ncbi:hypothetical protein B0T24DRAFT_221397 [Lasiosphaeria ovina]|uniref:Uncharacterized protein n=1 Tax=Lasiosphaeria ovina TaxID=92902 RepID=A0AAE0KGV2_9PEZI|nr:hypothetical protein B0T24DRAFT_221397 [Lasiosphaeria ovina]
MGSACSAPNVQGEIASEQKAKDEREARERETKEKAAREKEEREKLGRAGPPTRQVPPRVDEERGNLRPQPQQTRKEDLVSRSTLPGAGGPLRGKALPRPDDEDEEEEGLTALALPLLHIGAVVLETWIRLDEQPPTVDKPSGLQQRHETAPRGQRQNPQQPRNPRSVPGVTEATGSKLGAQPLSNQNQEINERVPESFETFVQALCSKPTPPLVNLANPLQGASVPVSKWSIHPALSVSLTKSKPYIIKLVSPVFRWLPDQIVSVEVVGTRKAHRPDEKAANSSGEDVPANPKDVDATVSNMFGFLNNNYAMIKDPSDDNFDTRVLLSVVGDVTLSHVKVLAQAIVYFELALEAALTRGMDTKTSPLSQSGYEIWLTAPSKTRTPRTLDAFMDLIKDCGSLDQLIELMNPRPPAPPQGVPPPPPRYFRWDLQRLRTREPSDLNDSEPSVIVFHLGNSCTSSDDLLRALDFAATFVPSALFVLSLKDLRREYSNSVDGLNRFMRDSFVKQNDIRPLNPNTMSLLNSRVEITLPTGRANKSIQAQDEIIAAKQIRPFENSYGDPALDKLRRCRARLT